MIARIIAVLLVLLAARDSAAHRLDEYLQAARVSFTHEGVALELDLTPGMQVADTILALVDRNGDQVISPEEARAYGEAVLRDLEIFVDGRAFALTLSHVEVSSVDELRAGLGVVQVRAVSGPSGARARGRHVLRLRNNHLPETSVYLANALLPRTDGIQVVAQRRDPAQRSFEVDYDFQPPPTARLWWVIAGITVVAAGIARSEFGGRA